jgi:hypothetical protein
LITDGWIVSHCVHVIPDADLISHELSPDCPCGPDEETYDHEADGVTDKAFLFSHHPLDGRVDPDD